MKLSEWEKAHLQKWAANHDWRDNDLADRMVAFLESQDDETAMYLVDRGWLVTYHALKIHEENQQEKP